MDTQSVFEGRVSWSLRRRLRVMTDIERRLSSFSIPIIGDAHIGPRTLLVVQYNLYGFDISLTYPSGE